MDYEIRRGFNECASSAEDPMASTTLIRNWAALRREHALVQRVYSQIL
jgi:hypothetical protein